MLEVLGDEYISQHIAAERYKREQQYAFEIYVTDALYAIANGRRLEKRYYDIVESAKKPQQEELTLDEMIAIMEGVTA